MVGLYAEDVYCLGLLYVYEYSGGIEKMVKLEDLEKFYNEIAQNLKDMGVDSVSPRGYIYPFDESIYFVSHDQDGNVFYILNPGFNKNRARAMYIGCLPAEVIVASQKNNALANLGLIKNEEKKIVQNMERNEGQVLKRTRDPEE